LQHKDHPNNSVPIITLLSLDEYNYHNATRMVMKKLIALGNKVKRLCVMKKWFLAN